MLLLADENFPLPTIEELRRDGHDDCVGTHQCSRRERFSSARSCCIPDNFDVRSAIFLLCKKKVLIPQKTEHIMGCR
jgi:hypothetical protein